MQVGWLDDARKVTKAVHRVESIMPWLSTKCCKNKMNTKIRQTEKEAATSIDARCRSPPEQAAALIPGVAADVNPEENQEDQQDP